MVLLPTSSRWDLPILVLNCPTVIMTLLRCSLPLPTSQYIKSLSTEGSPPDIPVIVQSTNYSLPMIVLCPVDVSLQEQIQSNPNFFSHVGLGASENSIGFSFRKLSIGKKSLFWFWSTFWFRHTLHFIQLFIVLTVNDSSIVQ